MEGVPEAVKNAFDRLKAEYQFYIVLKRFKDKYYVYRHTGIWDRKLKRTRTKAEYLGRIKDDGLFIKKKLSAKDDLENAKALIAEHGGEIIWYEKKELGGAAPPRKEITVKEADLSLLMALSMNARMPMPKLAAFAGLNEQTAYSRIKTLDERLGIKYLLEIDVEKLGYIRYLILIKFEDDAPMMEEIEEAIKDENRIQFAAITKGDYDVVMYVIDETPLEAHDNLIKLRQKEPFSKYRASWTLTYFAQTYSFMPLRDEFIENILKEKVWHRTKESPRPDKDKLKLREFLILKELNSNSNSNFTLIDQKHNLNKGTSRYAYQALRERGIITRPTISMTKLPIKYVGVILISNMHYKTIQENRYKYLLDEIEYGKVANRYCLTGNIGAPASGGISFLPVAEDGDFGKAVENIEKELQGSIVRSLVVTDVIIGTLCYRRFDNMYSRQYRLLVEFKKLEPAKPTFYG